jgi:hypothetical protein
MNRRTASLVLIVTILSACSHKPPQTASVIQQAAPFDPGYSISAADLRRDLFIFADDSFRGRETGTADAQRAAAFLARRAQQLGLEPAGDSLYMQRVPLARQVFTRATRIAVTTSNGREQTLRLGADVAPMITLDELLKEPKRNADGEMIFVGYGPADDAESEALARYDLEGKVLVAIHGAPPKSKPDVVRRLESRRLLGERLSRLVALRPSAIVLLMTGGAEHLYDRLAPRLLRSVVLDKPGEHPDDVSADSARALPAILVGVARRGSPLLPTGWPNDATPQALGRQLAVHLDVERQPFTGYNVAAVLRGTDPRMNKTYLAYGAHYDHIGILPQGRQPGRRARIDSIGNGADDNGSGSIALLAIARQMSYLRPRRSVLFVWHVGEEKGLVGSSYFTAHATVPIDSIVTELNADAIAGNSESTLSLVGPRAAPNYLSWRVGMVVDSINFAASTPLKIDRLWDDPDDPDEMFERGDHYSYAKRAIPTLFFTTCCTADHHTVSDEPQKIEYDKLARVAELMLESGFAIANRSQRPTSEVLTQSISSRQH